MLCNICYRVDSGPGYPHEKDCPRFGKVEAEIDRLRAKLVQVTKEREHFLQSSYGSFAKAKSLIEENAALQKHNTGMIAEVKMLVENVNRINAENAALKKRVIELEDICPACSRVDGENVKLREALEMERDRTECGERCAGGGWPNCQGCDDRILRALGRKT